MKCKTIKLKDKVKENLNNLGYVCAFLDRISMAPSMKEIIDKLNFIKFKFFCSVKDTVKRKKATDWKKIFSEDTSNKVLLSKICKIKTLKLNYPHGHRSKCREMRLQQVARLPLPWQ